MRADIDVVVGNNGHNQVFFNDGSGGFTENSSSAIAIGSYDTHAIALGDVNNDGGARGVARARRHACPCVPQRVWAVVP